MSLFLRVSRLAARPFLRRGLATKVALSKGAKPSRLEGLRAPITVTDAALARIQTLLASNEAAVGVRVGVKTRGCNGYSFTLNYAEEAQAGDEVVEEQGIKIFIESKALFHTVGTQMDFQDTALASEFVFENPNASGVCGCGESFSV